MSSRRILIVLWISITCPLAAQEKPKEVQPQETIRFDQDKAKAHMRELEERMFRLANMIRDEQPDDSARLLMGVQRAREHLIAEQMGQAAELLETLKLEQAVGEQAEIINKLEELKRLLLTADIGLEIKLEQLRQIREARAQLARLTEAEQRQNEQTESLNKQNETDPEKFENLQPGEQRNQRTGEDLEQLIKRLGPSCASAAGAVGGACQCMGNAAAKLGELQGKPASKEQQEALQKLNEADKTLADAEEQLKKEIEALVRQQVMEHLQAMITMQRDVRETTEKLAPRVADGTAQSVVAVRKLAESEEDILAVAQVCLDLCELTEFSVVFPSALGDVMGKMVQVRDQLTAGRADDETILLEREIEEDLQSLLAALQQASKKSLDPQVSNGQCMGCKGNLNKLLAELKMLRHMEQSVHKQTNRLDAKLAREEISIDQRIEQAQPLSARQEDVRGALEKIQKEFGGE